MACSMLSQTSMYVTKPDDALMAAASETQLPFHRRLRPQYASGRHQKASRAFRNAKIEIFEDSVGIYENLACRQQEESDIGTTFAKAELKITSKVTKSAAARTSQASEIGTKRPSTSRNRLVKQAFEIEDRLSTSVNTSSLTQHSTSTKHYSLYPISRPSQLISFTTKQLQEIHKPNSNVLAQDWFGLDTGKENVPPGLHSPKLSSKSVFVQDNSPKQSRANPPVSNVSVSKTSVVRSLQYTAASAKEITTTPISKAGASNEIKVVSSVGKVVTSPVLTNYQQPLMKVLEPQHAISVQNWLLTEEQVVARLACDGLLNQQHRSHRLILLNTLAKQLTIIVQELSVETKHSHDIVLQLSKQARCLLAWTETQVAREDHEYNHTTWLNLYCLELLMAIFETASNSHSAIVALEDGCEVYTN